MILKTSKLANLKPVKASQISVLSMLNTSGRERLPLLPTHLGQLEQIPYPQMLQVFEIKVEPLVHPQQLCTLYLEVFQGPQTHGATYTIPLHDNDTRRGSERQLYFLTVYR